MEEYRKGELGVNSLSALGALGVTSYADGEWFTLAGCTQ